jgi:hypothetical protein
VLLGSTIGRHLRLQGTTPASSSAHLRQHLQPRRPACRRTKSRCRQRRCGCCRQQGWAAGGPQGGAAAAPAAACAAAAAAARCTCRCRCGRQPAARASTAAPAPALRAAGQPRHARRQRRAAQGSAAQAGQACPRPAGPVARPGRRGSAAHLTCTRPARMPQRCPKKEACGLNSEAMTSSAQQMYLVGSTMPKTSLLPGLLWLRTTCRRRRAARGVGCVGGRLWGGGRAGLEAAGSASPWGGGPGARAGAPAGGAAACPWCASAAYGCSGLAQAGAVRPSGSAGRAQRQAAAAAAGACGCGVGPQACWRPAVITLGLVERRRRPLQPWGRLCLPGAAQPARGLLPLPLAHPTSHTPGPRCPIDRP